VFGVPDERFGEVVGIMVVLKNDKKHTTSMELINFVKPHLAHFKIPLPQHIFFSNESLPRNASQKVLKKDIRTKIQHLLHPIRSNL